MENQADEENEDSINGIGSDNPNDGSSNKPKKQKTGENPNDLKPEHVKPGIDNVKYVVERGSQLPWSHTLCGSFTGGKEEPEFSLVNDVIRSLWRQHGIEVENILKKANGFYIFNFKTHQGMVDALAKSPWIIGDVQILLKRWGPGHFRLDKPKTDRLPFWIQIYDIPLGLWKLDVVKIMSSFFGIPMAVDQHTRSICETGPRASEYARVLVDIGTPSNMDENGIFSVSFPDGGDGYLLSDLRIKYTYMCSYCKVNDHKDSTCFVQMDLGKSQAKLLKEMHSKKEQDERRRYEAQDTAMNVVDDKAQDTAMNAVDDKAQDTTNTIKVTVARDEDLIEQIGKDIYLDLVNHAKVWSVCVDMKMPFNSVKEAVAKEFDVPVENQRFWTWAKRQNHTYRPYRPLTSIEETHLVGQLRAVYNKNNSNAELNLLLEKTAIGPDSRLLPPPNISKEDILVFFKLYEPDKSQLRYVGPLFVRSWEKPTGIISRLNEKVGFSPDEEIELYEEIKFERYHEQEFDPCVMCERLDMTTSFGSSQISNGDIICFQKVSHAGDKYKCPDVPSFLEFVHNRQEVHFRSKEKPNEEAFSLELSKLHTYDDVAGKVAEKLNVDDPSKIRFTPHNYLLKDPEIEYPIEYQAEGHLLDILGSCNEGYNILYYEVLDISLPELQCQKTLKVAFYTTKEEPIIHSVMLPKQSTVGDVLTEINRKVNVSNPNAELRLLQLFNNMIYTVFTPTEKIEDIDDEYRTLRAEEIPEEEKNLGPGDQRIQVYHFTKEAEQNQMVKIFGDPFFLVIREGETLASVKARIQRRLEVPDDEFSKWKFAFVRYQTSPEYLQDSAIVSTCFQRTAYGDWKPLYLGLEHLEQPAGCLNK